MTSTEKLIEKIRDICSTNADVDWLENDPSEEFAEIVKLIDGENKSWNPTILKEVSANTLSS